MIGLECRFFWQGKGWYAPIARKTHEEEWVEYHCLEAGKSWYNDAEREARERNLGTPAWYDRLPDGAIIADWGSSRL